MYEKTADANGDVKQKNDAKSRAKELKAVEIKLEQQYGELAPIHSRHTRFLRRLVHHISERQRHHESVQKVILARARGQSLPPERAPEPFRRRERGRAQTAHRRRKQSFQPSQRRERRVKTSADRRSHDASEYQWDSTVSVQRRRASSSSNSAGSRHGRPSARDFYSSNAEDAMFYNSFYESQSAFYTSRNAQNGGQGGPSSSSSRGGGRTSGSGRNRRGGHRR